MNICFICTGNTCRSPLAEGLLRSKELPGVAVRSAGIYAADGMPISDHSKDILENNGFPYTPVSRQFSRADAEWADLILTMTAGHRETLRRSYADHAAKVFTLKEYTGQADHDVQDPFGGSFSLYESTFGELAEQIDLLASRLLGEQ